MINDGRIKISKDVKIKSIEIQKKLKKKNEYINDTLAIVKDLPNWEDRPLSIHFRTIDYATVSSLRKLGRRPKIISTCAVLICLESRDLILHRRSSKSDTFPNCLHTIGGAFIPLGKFRQDGKKLIRTMKREVLEETGLSISISSKLPILLSEEIDTGYIQFSWLGVKVELRDLRNIETNWEGEVVLIPFDELEAKILSQKENWTPSGKMQILSWLALGAPGCKFNEIFGKLRATELYSHIVSKQ